LAPSLDHPGPMATCVRDLAILLRAMAGEFPKTTTPERPKLVRVRGLFDRLAEPSVRAAMDEVVARLSGQFVVEEADLPPRFDDVLDRHVTLMAYEAAAWHRDRFARHPDDYPPKIRGLIERGLATSPAECDTCKQHQRELTADVDAFLQNRILLTPATPGPAPLADTTGSPAFNSPWSYVGTPTVSFPTNQLVDGLPLAIQLVGPRFGDGELLDFAERCEATLSPPSHKNTR
jgi:aspartyl-tRNA(Asn)/glutamyl-tRNA(Gln) amidotransferase subunit A